MADGRASGSRWTIGGSGEYGAIDDFDGAEGFQIIGLFVTSAGGDDRVPQPREHGGGHAAYATGRAGADHGFATGQQAMLFEPDNDIGRAHV